MASAALHTITMRERLDALGPWFQNMCLDGEWTAPGHFLGDYPAVKFAGFAHALPDVTGLSVLDIGCNAGFYSFEMKRRGAARVVGIDSEPLYTAQARFAAQVLGLDVDIRDMGVFDVARLGERFDLVIFMGVLYHLRHPLLALDLIHEHVAKDMLLFQSLTRGVDRADPVDPDYDFFAPSPFDREDWPRLNFVEHRYSGDDSNWWIPNRAGVEAMLRSSGFRIEARPEAEVYLARREAKRPWGANPVYPAETA